MPYSKPSDAPEYIDESHKAQWVKVFNSAYAKAKSEGKSDKDSESYAFSVASGVVKREKSSDTLTEIAAGAQKITAQEAAYMELPGAVKDAGCQIVDVPGGVSSQKGCCDVYHPVASADEFKCGECIHLSILDKKTLDTSGNLVYDDNVGTHLMESPQISLEDLIPAEKLKASKRKAIIEALRDELKLDDKADFKKEEVLAADQDYATVSGEKVHKSDFAYAPAGSSPSEWKLPVHDESHTRNALARFNQADLPADAKEGVKRKILERAHKYGIDTSGFEGKHEKASEKLSDEHSQRMFWLLSDLSPQTLNGKKVVEIPICITGTWVKGDHKFSITSADIDSMISNFESRANGQTVIDYEHASEMPELARGGAIPAAGWMHGLRKRKIHNPRTNELVDALTALAEWTPKAEEMLANGEYRFFSPAIDWSKTDKTSGKAIGATLTSGALTNHPFLEELPPITLSDHIILGDKSDFKSESVLATSPGAVHIPSAEMADKEKKKMAKKKLKLEKIASGDKAGKYGVFDADNQALLHVFHSQKMNDAIETMNDFEKSEILADFDPDNDGDNDASAKGDTDKDAAGKKEKASEVESKTENIEVPNAGGESVKLSATAENKVEEKLKEVKSEVAVPETKKSEAQLLSDCIHIPTSEAGTQETSKAAFDMDKVTKMAESGELTVKSFLTVNSVTANVDQLVKEGKILPSQRASMLRIALSDPDGFKDFAAKAQPVINLEVIGVKGGEKELKKKLNDSGDATAVYLAKVDELKKENKYSFEKAHQEASHRFPVEYKAYIEQTLRLSEEPNPELTPTVMLSSRSR